MLQISWCVTMNKSIVVIKVILVISAMLSSNFGYCVQQEVENNLANKSDIYGQVRQLLKQRLPTAAIGVLVQDAKTGKTLYAQREQELFIPASTAKLLTAVGVIKGLGADYKFTTTLTHNKNNLKNGKLNGNVVMEFTGDPSFTSAKLQQLVRTMKQQISAINGDLLIDDTAFAGPEVAPGWLWDDMNWYFAPLISAIVLDENKIDIELRPSNKLDEAVGIKLVGENGKLIKLVANTVKTVSLQDSEERCQLELQMDAENAVSFGGCWPVEQVAVPTTNAAVTVKVDNKVDAKIAVRNIKRLVADKLKVLLAAEHIKLTGEIKFASDLQFKAFKSEQDLLAVDTSEAASSMLSQVLLESNNLYAGALFKALGRKVYGVGSFKNGELALRNILQKFAGVDFTQIKLTDGAGLSIYNLISPQQLVAVLAAINTDVELRQYCLPALARSNHSGTLKNRLLDFFPGTLVGKTGTMRGISGFAGYLTTKNNKQLLVTILVNNSMLRAAEVRKIENDLYALLYQA